MVQVETNLLVEDTLLGNEEAAIAKNKGKQWFKIDWQYMKESKDTEQK